MCVCARVCVCACVARCMLDPCVRLLCVMCMSECADVQEESLLGPIIYVCARMVRVHVTATVLTSNEPPHLSSNTHEDTPREEMRK